VAAFVYDGTHPLDGSGQTADQATGMHNGPVRCRQGAFGFRDPNATRQLSRTEQMVTITQPKISVGFDGRFNRRALVRTASHSQNASAPEVRVDVLARQDRSHLVDGAGNGQELFSRGILTVAVGEFRGADGKAGGQPGAISPGRTETRDFALDQGNSEIGIAAQQVVGRPQPGKPGAENGDIDGLEAGERRPGGEIVPSRLQPVTESGVVRNYRYRIAAAASRAAAMVFSTSSSVWAVLI
jgi:hypothetical protein